MRYTSHLHPMFLPVTRSRSTALLLVLALTASLSSYAQTNDMDSASPWSRPAHDLVQQVLEATATPSSVSYDIENSSSLSPADFQQVRLALSNEFRAAKVRVVRMESAVAEIKFILSRNAHGLIWIAQVKQGTTEQVSMVEFPDPTADDPSVHATLFRLQRTLLLARAAPMLDVAVGSNFLLVLGSEQISLYPRDNVSASAIASVAITHAGPWPRDLRGRIFLNGGPGDFFTAYLPGVRCNGTFRPALTAQCLASDDPWPLLQPDAGATVPAAFFGSARNHFSGVLAGTLAASSVPPFFAAARLGDGDSSLWAFSGTDGFTRLYIRIEKAQQPGRSVASLGSDLAAVQSDCGARWQLLVTGDGDETSPDALQAYEIRDREAAAVSEKVAFDGPVTALWSAEPRAATVIVRHLGKESYEASSVSITCGR